MADSSSALPALPDFVRPFTVARVAAQRVPWHPASWQQVFAGHPQLFEALTAHVNEAGGISRDFVHDRADGDPIELFLAAMAWGWGTVGYGPARVEKMLAE